MQVAFMPHDLRSIDVYYHDRFLATAIDQADAKAIEQRTRRARRAARLRVAPITAAGEIDEITPPPPPPPPGQGLGVLRLLGRADRLNQARDEEAGQ